MEDIIFREEMIDMGEIESRNDESYVECAVQNLMNDFPNIKEIFLFGSYLKSENSNYNDIDLGLVCFDGYGDKLLNDLKNYNKLPIVKIDKLFSYSGGGPGGSIKNSKPFHFVICEKFDMYVKHPLVLNILNGTILASRNSELK